MANRFTSGLPSTDNVPKWDKVCWVEYHRTYLQPLEAVGGQPRVLDRMLEAGHHILNVAHPTRGVAVDVLVDAAKVNLGRLKNPQTCMARLRGRSQVCVSQNFCVLGID